MWASGKGGPEALLARHPPERKPTMGMSAMLPVATSYFVPAPPPWVCQKINVSWAWDGTTMTLVTSTGGAKADASSGAQSVPLGTPSLSASVSQELPTVSRSTSSVFPCGTRVHVMIDRLVHVTVLPTTPGVE